jgi:hypothetical protein
MSVKKILPKFEVLIIIVFFFSFMIWAVSKCNATKRQLQEKAAISQPVPEPTSPAAIATEQTQTVKPAADSVANTESPRITRERYQPLYVTIDGLNLRSEPSLKGKVLHQLKLFEEVEFMNQVTDSTEEISLGKEIADEPWVKVKSSRGHVGWVYGAGVSYYKKKHPGAE